MSLPVIEKQMIDLTDHVTLDMTELFPFEETEDPNVRAHYVNPPKNLHIWVPGMTTQELVDIARATGQELVALCDYRWVPKHNPDKFDLCEKCNKIAHDIMAGAGE